MRRVLQFRVNSMTQKAFIVRKERKQSYCRRRRKPAFPNCASIDEPLSDNALDIYFCLVSPLHRCTSAHWWCSRFRIIFFYINIHRRRMLIKVNINGGRCAIGWREFTRAFINPLNLTIEKTYVIKTRGRGKREPTRVSRKMHPLYKLRNEVVFFLFFFFLIRLIHRDCET